jgi:hypothetical protein
VRFPWAENEYLGNNEVIGLLLLPETGETGGQAHAAA